MRCLNRRVPLVLCLCLSASMEAIVRAQPSSPVGLAVNDRVEPIGIGDGVHFSWFPRDEKPGEIQAAYQIRVGSSAAQLAAGHADLWDSGKVLSSAVAGVPYEGRSLRSREICYWQVRAWNSCDHCGPWSSVARFETGLLTNEEWGAAWIWCDKKEESEDYVYFRKSTCLPDKPVTRARVYVTAGHRHEFHVNGKPVGKGPNFAYPQFQYYQTFDITPFLNPGKENSFGLLCHWYGAGQGRPYSHWGLLFKAVIDFEDGSSMELASDRSWKMRRGEWKVPPGKISAKNFRNGNGIPAESIDGQEYPVGWDLPGYDDTGWESAVEFGLHPFPPFTGLLTAQESSMTEYAVEPVGVVQIGPGHVVADFGKVYSGMPCITFENGSPGQVVKIKVDYRARPDGTLAGFAQDTPMDYEYTLRGGSETFRPYWYLGFRFIEVENAPPAFDGASMRLIVRHNRVDTDASSFESSDPTLNAVWDLAKRSVMLGSQEQFVDTPTREQGQFTYDAYQISVGAMKCFRERLLSRQGLGEFAQSQALFHHDTGKVNAVYPNGDGRRDIPDWTQCWVIWAWEYYLETGDREFIRRIFHALVRTGDYVKGTENRVTGLVDLGNAEGYASGIVDWPERYGYDRQTTQRTIMSLNAYLDYACIARLGKEIGDKSGVVERFDQYSRDVLSAIHGRLWDDSQQAYIDGLYADGSRSDHASQQANAMLLALDLVAPGRKAGALAAVKRAGHSTGPILARYLIQAYGENDEDEYLLEWLTNPKGRNLAYTLADGGSFTYEHWLGRNSEEGGDGASESHAFGANVGVVALQQYILGVKILAPQGARLLIRPHVAGLQFARGTIPTQNGQVEVSWRSEDRFTLDVTLPCNVRADVYVPAGRTEGEAITVNGRSRQGEHAGTFRLFRDIGSGRHVFVRQGLPGTPPDPATPGSESDSGT